MKKLEFSFSVGAKVLTFATTLEHILVIPQNVRYRVSIRPSNFMVGKYAMEKQTYLHKNLYKMF